MGLAVERVTKRFGGVVACEEVSLTVERGEIRCVIGPNGAGKTTLLKLISGHETPNGGHIRLDEHDVTHAGVVDRVRRGIGRKFQTPEVFDELSVADNLELGLIRTGLRGTARQRRRREILELIELAPDHERRAEHLAHGQRQWLEIGLLLAADASFLLLDEPAAGMTGEERVETVKLLKALGHQGKGVIVIEHDMKFVEQLGAPILVMNLGRPIADGSFVEISANSEVQDAYLGNADT